MNATLPAELRAQLQRLWDRGELLRATVGEAIEWPLRLPLKSPSATDLADRFDAVRDWVVTLTAVTQWRIEWRDWHHRIQGTQRLPAAVWVDSLAQALAILGKSAEAQRFVALWQDTTAAQPLLLPWLRKRPLQALQHAGQWQRLLAVVAWLQAHPRPGVYLRQVDAAGVDSKFIEARRGVLAELLDLALPAAAIDTAANGAAGFNRRYGFLDKPLRVRFRLLDPALPCLPGCRGLADISLDAASFAALELPVLRVFVTENETNFLAFPAMPQAIVVFGAGYGWEVLATSAWLQRVDVHYWGDIDTHGFAILDGLRHHLPQAASLLMDRETLLSHREQWGEEPEPTRQPLSRLDAYEAALYDALRFDHLGRSLRLEQERVGYRWLRDRLAGIGEAPTR